MGVIQSHYTVYKPRPSSSGVIGHSGRPLLLWLLLPLNPPLVWDLSAWVLSVSRKVLLPGSSLSDIRKESSMLGGGRMSAGGI